MSGYIYCITNSHYKFDDTYKLGYTAINIPLEDAKKKLLQRYETYFVNAECMMLILVRQPIKAERRLFELLRDYNTQKEMFKADYDTIIKPAMEQVIKEFNINIKVDNKDRYTGKISKINKKIPYYSRNICSFIILLNEQQSLYGASDKLNTANEQLIQMLRSHCERYDCMVNKNIHFKKSDKKVHYDLLSVNMLFSFKCFDWEDSNLNKFLDKLIQF
jgi:hypothetical protein